MARPRSDEKRAAILAAATSIIVERGLSAPTAGIAKRAGVANGSFFTYFETKSDLLNQLYLELKRDMAAAVFRDFPESAPLRTQAQHAWRNWVYFAISFPDKRRAITQLTVSDEITPETRAIANKVAPAFGQLLMQVRAHGSLQDVPVSFAATIMTSLAEATMDAMIQDPANADQHCESGFQAFWRAVS